MNRHTLLIAYCTISLILDIYSFITNPNLISWFMCLLMVVLLIINAMNWGKVRYRYLTIFAVGSAKYRRFVESSSPVMTKADVLYLEVDTANCLNLPVQNVSLLNFQRLEKFYEYE